MPQPKSRKYLENYVWKKLVEKITKTTSSNEIESLLDRLLTAHEREQVIKRVAAASLLKQRKTYKEIGETLWLSPQTISAIRKSFRENKSYVSRYTDNKKRGKNQKRTESGYETPRPYSSLMNRYGKFRRPWLRF